MTDRLDRTGGVASVPDGGPYQTLSPEPAGGPGTVPAPPAPDASRPNRDGKGRAEPDSCEGDGDAKPPASNGDELVPGQVVYNRYQVERPLGRGGMGRVWLVRHLTLDAERALKLIAADIASDPQSRRRFEREARVMASFTHPNAVTVHDAVLDRRRRGLHRDGVCPRARASRAPQAGRADAPGLDRPRSSSSSATCSRSPTSTGSSTATSSRRT